MATKPPTSVDSTHEQVKLNLAFETKKSPSVIQLSEQVTTGFSSSPQQKHTVVNLFSGPS